MLGYIKPSKTEALLVLRKKDAPVKVIKGHGTFVLPFQQVKSVSLSPIVSNLVVDALTKDGVEITSEITTIFRVSDGDDASIAFGGLCFKDVDDMRNFVRELVSCEVRNAATKLISDDLNAFRQRSINMVLDSVRRTVQKAGLLVDSLEVINIERKSDVTVN